MKKQIGILGTRGIPAMHGGFETFAEHFAIYLQRKDWQVTVYCQEEGHGEIYEDHWYGIRRVHIPVTHAGAIGTMVFDWRSTLHAIKCKSSVLTLGYNTAVFCVLYRLKGIKNVINMDGIEWQRGKWSRFERTWLYINEKIGAWLGNHLIADHPEIKKHLSQFVSEKKITVIPYSANILVDVNETILESFKIEANRYAIIIARPEQENSILEIVTAFSKKKRKVALVVLGKYSPEINKYHKQVIDAASEEVKFVGAIYEKDVVQALRFFARFYIHGHTVGGTNPSLVEALGAGSPVLAHDNKFNNWVAGDKALYFSSTNECVTQIDRLLTDDKLIASMKVHSSEQMQARFTWEKIHQAYEKLLLSQIN